MNYSHYTAQQTFEHVVKHLFKQGRRSYSDASGCLYKGPNNTSCAVGCLIPDDVYSTGMEGKPYGNTSNLFDHYPVLTKVMPKHTYLLRSLQKVHDGNSVWKNEKLMRDVLRDVGKAHKLKISFLRNLKFPTKAT